jgi:hypothetical protein
MALELYDIRINHRYSKIGEWDTRSLDDKDVIDSLLELILIMKALVSYVLVIVLHKLQPDLRASDEQAHVFLIA